MKGRDIGASQVGFSASWPNWGRTRSKETDWKEWAMGTGRVGVGLGLLGVSLRVLIG